VNIDNYVATHSAT